MKQSLNLRSSLLGGLALATGAGMTVIPTTGYGLEGTRVGGPCTVTAIQGTFTQAGSRYKASGTCLYYTKQDAQGMRDGMVHAPFTAEGAVAQGGLTREEMKIMPPSEPRTMPGPRPQGRITATMNCLGIDRWLEPSGPKCGDVRINSQGDLRRSEVMTFYYENGDKDVRPATAWLKPAQRASLVEQRSYALDPQRRLETPVQGAKPVPLPPGALLVNRPEIVLPTAPPAVSTYRAQHPVTVRITPPPGIKVQTYSLQFEKRNNMGNWEPVVRLPVVQAAEAEGPGFAGFGTHNPGSSANMMTTPGPWRVRAQANPPTQSKWSEWRDFTVVPPDSPRLMTDQIQPAPQQGIMGSGLIRPRGVEEKDQQQVPEKAGDKAQ